MVLIKVVNNKFNMSCLWPLSKLKEKLVKLRKLVYTVRTLISQLSTIDPYK